MTEQLDKDKLLNWITLKLQELKVMEKRERRFNSIQGAAECVGARSVLMELRSEVTVGNFDSTLTLQSACEIIVERLA